MNTPILDKLSDHQVVGLKPYPTDYNSGSIVVYELCDNYYRCVLTKEEYIALAKEILAEAELL